MNKVVRRIAFCFYILCCSIAADAQIITTVAGCGIGDDSIATKCELGSPDDRVIFDTAGNMYIPESIGCRIRKISVSGIVSTFAGTGEPGNSGDGGPATAATFLFSNSIALDKFGNMYISDQGSNVIRKVNAAGIISTFAGTGTAGYSGDGGPATAAMLNNQASLITDTAGNLYIADWHNNRVRKVNTAGIITSVVGNGSLGATGNGGPATAAQLGAPARLAMDKKGNLYVAERTNLYICKVDTSGILTIIAGHGTYGTGTAGDGGPATAASMTAPLGLAVDTSGNVYFSDEYNSRIRKINISTGVITNFAGNASAGYSGDGSPATSAQFNAPMGLAFDNNENLYVCDADNNRIRKISATDIITTFAGQNGLFSDGYIATNAEINAPGNVCTDAAGNIYIADFINNRVRKVDVSTGIMTTVAGCGITGQLDHFSGDGGPATQAHIYNAVGMAVDRAGNIYIADTYNQRIRMVNSAGIISTIAGNGTAGYTGDHIRATTAELNYPSSVAVDSSGNVYIADNYNSRIRKINTSGIISTVAGADTAGYSGDGGPATNAMLAYPVDISLDGAGNLYIADAENFCIRKVDTAGIITTFAGTYATGYSGDGGPASLAQISYPGSVRADNAGNVFIADGGNQRIRMVNTSGIISTVAGNGATGFSGDGGPATNAMISSPTGVAIDQSGNLYLADGYNFRIRKVAMNYLKVPGVNSTKTDISIYPNPTTGKLTIVNAINTNVNITDITGKTIMQFHIETVSKTIDISRLRSGMYSLVCTDSTGVTQRVKIIKE